MAGFKHLQGARQDEGGEEEDAGPEEDIGCVRAMLSTGRANKFSVQFLAFLEKSIIKMPKAQLGSRSEYALYAARNRHSSTGLKWDSSMGHFQPRSIKAFGHLSPIKEPNMFSTTSVYEEGSKEREWKWLMIGVRKEQRTERCVNADVVGGANAMGCRVFCQDKTHMKYQDVKPPVHKASCPTVPIIVLPLPREGEATHLNLLSSIPVL